MSYFKNDCAHVCLHREGMHTGLECFGQCVGGSGNFECCRTSKWDSEAVGNRVIGVYFPFRFVHAARGEEGKPRFTQFFGSKRTEEDMPESGNGGIWIEPADATIYPFFDGPVGVVVERVHRHIAGSCGGTLSVPAFPHGCCAEFYLIEPAGVFLAQQQVVCDIGVAIVAQNATEEVGSDEAGFQGILIVPYFFGEDVRATLPHLRRNEIHGQSNDIGSLRIRGAAAIGRKVLVSNGLFDFLESNTVVFGIGEFSQDLSCPKRQFRGEGVVSGSDVACVCTAEGTGRVPEVVECKPVTEVESGLPQAVISVGIVLTFDVADPHLHGGIHFPEKRFVAEVGVDIPGNDGSGVAPCGG